MEKKINFALDKSTIGSWVNGQSQDMMSKGILSAETIQMIEVIPNIKYKHELKYISTDAIFQAGACSFTTSGTTTLTKKDIQNYYFQVAETLCPKDLEDTALSLSMKPGFNETIPFEGQYTELKIKTIQKQMEDKIWVGASGSTTFAGLLNQFSADSSVINANVDFSATGLTDSALIALFETMITNIPEEIISLGDIFLWMGHDMFRRLSKAFLNTNNVLLQKFNWNGIDVFDYPGAEFVKIRPVNGLNASNNTSKKCVITPASNLVFGTDLLGEETNCQMWFSQDDQNVKFLARFSGTVGYYFSEYVVISKK